MAVMNIGNIDNAYVGVHGPFDEIEKSWADDCVFVYKDNLKGLILTDNTAISCCYDDIGPCYDNTMFARTKGRWYLIDKNENRIYDYGAHDGTPIASLLIVKKDGLYGAIGKSGDVILPFIYENIYRKISKPYRSQYCYNIFALVGQDGMVELADSYGKIVTSRKYHPILGCSDYSTDTYSNETVNDIINLNDVDENPVVMFNCKTLMELNEYVPGQQVSDTAEIWKLGAWHFELKRDGVSQLMNANGEIVVPFENGYEKFGEVSPNEYLIAARKNCKWGYVSDYGVEKIKCKYDFVKPFINGYAIVGYWDNNTPQSLYGVIHHHGNEMVPCIYRHLEGYGSMDGKFYILTRNEIDESIKEVHCTDGSICNADSNGNFIIDNKQYCIEFDINQVDTEPNYEPTVILDKTRWEIVPKGKCEGVMDYKGRYVVKPIFDHIYSRDTINGIFYLGEIGNDKYVIVKK